LKLIADCYFFARKYEKALYWYKQAVQTSSALVDTTDVYFLEVNSNMGDIYYAAGKMKDALQCYQQALSIRNSHYFITERDFGPQSSKVKTPSTDYLVLLMSAGDVYYSLADYSNATAEYEQALNGWLKWSKRLSEDTAASAKHSENNASEPAIALQRIGMCEYGLAITSEQKGDSGKARRFYKASMRDLAKAGAAANSTYIIAAKNYARFLRAHDFILGFFETLKVDSEAKGLSN
jgi:tetratricopeptide (TPR) repeat protein